MEPDGSGEHGQEIRVYASKTKALAWTAMGLGLTGLGVFAAFSPDKFERDVPGIIYLVWIGVLVFGVATARFLLWLVPCVPILTFTHEGVRVDPVLLGDYVIPWAHVRALDARVVEGYRTLYVVLDDPKFLIDRQSSFRCGIERELYPRLRSTHMIPVPGAVLSGSISGTLTRVRTEFGDEIARHGIRVIVGTRGR